MFPVTGYRTCKKRPKPLRRKRSKTFNTSTSHSPRGHGSKMTKKQLRWLSSEAEDQDVDWPGLPPASDSPLSKDHSKSRPCSSLLQSPQGQGFRTPQFGSSRGGKDVASPSAPITNNPEYQRTAAENKLIRENLAEMKKKLAFLKAHQKQTPQKQISHPVPTRLGSSVSVNTSPDLTVTLNSPDATWTNLE
ncbi:hypothetical protein HPB52_012227 [Rhipicephalus sanguineus]|uniref:Uncharacterized protein n=1 Tax=Rhipicephalus sanguineus TaxID=34632 RepID=A0A9D4PGQ6_RHISA|nr:hypothetical protein HPB52_012227 [Rhipicephalus sanguineus]